MLNRWKLLNRGKFRLLCWLICLSTFLGVIMTPWVVTAQSAQPGKQDAIICPPATRLPGLVPKACRSRPSQPPTPSPDRSTNRELRGVWITNIDSNVLFNRDQLTNAVQQLAAVNFNTIYPAVWNWGYTLYPSAIAQREIGFAVDPRPAGLQQWDMLKAAVEIGHKQGLSVIPWFEFGFMAPADSELAQLHPTWLTEKQNGDQVWLEGTDRRMWLNPFHPEVQKFITDLILEIITKYDVDGIQLDDHYGLPIAFGYDDYTKGLYRQTHNGQAPPTNPQDAEWIRWRADRITAFTQQLVQAVKAKKPKVIFSLSPNNYDFAYNVHLQDWRTWEQQGWLDELIVQVYRDNLNSFTEELTRPEIQAARTRTLTGVGILTGLRGRPVPMQRIQTQIQTARKQGLSGVSFFFYETLWNLANEPAESRKSAFKTLFPAAISRLKMND
jgi:uncharacterized lipoprotein YddW (UPF0748 family)